MSGIVQINHPEIIFVWLQLMKRAMHTKLFSSLKKSLI